MTPAVFALLFLTGAPPHLMPVNLSGLSFSMPERWKRTTEGDTTRVSSPDGDAYFEVDTGKVQAKHGLEPAECLGKITTAMTGEWTKQKVDGQPAASKTDLDKDAKGAEFVTVTTVGCNGTRTFSLTFHTVGGRRDINLPIADMVLKSVRYK